MVPLATPLPHPDDPEGLYALMPGHPSYVGKEAVSKYFGIAYRDRLHAAWRAAHLTGDTADTADSETASHAGSCEPA